MDSFRERAGLTEAASSSSAAVPFDISGSPRAESGSKVRAKSGSRARSSSTKGTKGETRDPETNVAKSRGRPKDPNSERQKALAAKASAISPGYPPARKGSQS